MQIQIKQARLQDWSGSGVAAFILINLSSAEAFSRSRAHGKRATLALQSDFSAQTLI